MDATDLRVRNYQFALDQTQQYLALALGSGVAVWLLRAPSPGAGPVSVAPFGVPVDPATASTLFFAIHVVTAALAVYALESAKRLVGPLAAQGELAAVLQDYPSVAASPWPGVRLAVPVLSLVLLAWTLLPRLSTPQSPTSGTLGVGLLVVSVHVSLLLLLWMPPLGPWTAYRPKALKD
jgi:hypothetical protein